MAFLKFDFSSVFWRSISWIVVLLKNQFMNQTVTFCFGKSIYGPYEPHISGRILTNRRQDPKLPAPQLFIRPYLNKVHKWRSHSLSLDLKVHEEMFHGSILNLKVHIHPCYSLGLTRRAATLRMHTSIPSEGYRHIDTSSTSPTFLHICLRFRTFRSKLLFAYF